MSKRSLNQDFLQHLRDAILRPMLKEGSEGVSESVKVSESKLYWDAEATAEMRAKAKNRYTN